MKTETTPPRKKEYAPQYVVTLSRKLRLDMTESEKRLWEKISNKQLVGLRFRRQHPIGRYIADFFCHERKLIIEIDGNIHTTQKEYDKHRDEHLAASGYSILRFTNEEIRSSLDSVLDRILEQVNEPQKSPLGGFRGQ